MCVGVLGTCHLLIWGNVRWRSGGMKIAVDSGPRPGPCPGYRHRGPLSVSPRGRRARGASAGRRTPRLERRPRRGVPGRFGPPLVPRGPGGWGGPGGGGSRSLADCSPAAPVATDRSPLAAPAGGPLGTRPPRGAQAPRCSLHPPRALPGGLSPVPMPGPARPPAPPGRRGPRRSVAVARGHSAIASVGGHGPGRAACLAPGRQARHPFLLPPA